MEHAGIRLLVVAAVGTELERLGDGDLGSAADIERVTTLAAAEDAVRTRQFEVIILDLALADSTRAVGRIHGFAAETPLIVVSAGDQGQVAHALQAGACDRLHPAELSGPVVDRVVARAHERSLTAARARDADHRFAAFIDTIPLGVTIVDSTFRTYYANGEAERILGSDLTLSGLVDVQPPPLEVALAGARASEQSAEFRRDGRRMLLQIEAFPVLAPDGSIEYAVAIVQDITERKRLERAARAMAKIDAMGAMAASVAHDFNNLLSVIGTFAYLALEELRPDNGAYDDVKEIIKATERSQHLVGKLLSFAREGGPTVADSDVNALILASKKMLSRLLGERIELDLDLQDALAHAAIAESEFEEILINLVVNARDAMPAGGTLTIRTRPGAASGAVGVEVIDTGIGMDARTLELLFEPLFTTKAPGKGTGLGLASVHSLVSEVGGEIEVASTLGEGTRFALSFPIVGMQSASQPPVAPLPSNMATDARTILVVEDEEPFRRMLVRQLGRLDYRVVEAANAREALEQIAASPRVDALLSDVDMPGLDGPTLAARIREILPNLPAVFMTGFDPPDVVETVLLKPFPLEELAAAIADAIDAGRAATPVR